MTEISNLNKIIETVLCLGSLFSLSLICFHYSTANTLKDYEAFAWSQVALRPDGNKSDRSMKFGYTCTSPHSIRRAAHINLFTLPF